MNGLVEKALDHAFNVICNGDQLEAEKANHVEKQINDLQILIDDSCVVVLAKQAPLAKDLRLVFAISKINTDLERMGDQALNIANAARDLPQGWSASTLPIELEAMIESVRAMLSLALDAFVQANAEVARQVLLQDDAVDNLRTQLVNSQITLMKRNPENVDECLVFIMIAKNLERVADHITNIAEEIIYMTTGDDVRHGHF